MSAASQVNGCNLLDFLASSQCKHFLPLGRGGLPDSKLSDITFGRRQPVVSEALEVGMEVMAIGSS